MISLVWVVASKLRSIGRIGAPIACALAIGASVINVDQANRAGDVDLRALIDDAQKAWAQLRNRYANSQQLIETVVTIKSESGGTNTSATEYLYKSRGNFRVIVQSPLKQLSPFAVGHTRPQREWTAFGLNDRYYFELVKPGDDAPWKLVKLDLRQDNETQVPRQIEFYDWEIRNQLLLISTEALPEIFSKPYFKLVSVQPIKKDGGEFLRCKVSYPHDKRERVGPKRQIFWADEFEIDLDPTDYYTLRGYRYTIPDPSSPGRFINHSAEYVTDPARAHTLVRQIQTGASGTESETLQPYTTIETTVRELRFGQRIPKSEFYLSAFGLPEPPGVRKRGVPWLLWLGGAGVLLVLAAFLVQRWRRKVA
jgi:hypothetical protein